MSVRIRIPPMERDPAKFVLLESFKPRGREMIIPTTPTAPKNAIYPKGFDLKKKEKSSLLKWRRYI